MRRPFFKSDLLSALGYALGNSFGAFISIKFDFSPELNAITTLFFCFAVGMLFDIPIKKIEQKYGSVTNFHIFLSFLLFVFIEYLAWNYLEYDLIDDFIENIFDILGYGLIVFLIKKAFLYWKIFKVKQKFGDGSKGYKKSSHKIVIKKNNDYKFNKVIFGNYSQKLAAICKNGIFVGKKHNGVIIYKGIPYAKPPIGELRWRKPAEPDTSNKVFEAYNFSSVLPQPNTFTFELSSYPQDENILTLNIWRPEKINGKLPVVVYFHGGDYTFGGSPNPLYDGEKFVKKNPNLIFISFNYRFGIFGIMDFSNVPGGEDYPESKDLIFYDQIAVLNWIKNNINAFGGDENNITLMGDTSGGSTALLLPIIKEAKGLFKRVISISSFPALLYKKEYAQQLTADIQKSFHIDNMDDFKKLTIEQLIAIEEKFINYLNYPIAGGLLPENIFESYKNGVADDIELIMGSNADEFNSFHISIGKDKSEYYCNFVNDLIKENINSSDLGLYQQFLDLADGDTKKIVNYINMHHQLLKIAQLHAKKGNSARYFRWDVKSPIKEFGAFSAIEIPFILNTLKNAEKYSIVGENYSGDLLQKMLLQFIAGENPSLKGGEIQHNEPIQWLPFKDSDYSILCFNSKGAILDSGKIMKAYFLVEEILNNNPGLISKMLFDINKEYHNIVP